MKTITLLFVLLLYPLKMPQGQDMEDTLQVIGVDTIIVTNFTYSFDNCSKVFRVDTCGRYIDSVWRSIVIINTQEILNSYEYFVAIKLCTTLVRDTVVFVGE